MLIYNYMNLKSKIKKIFLVVLLVTVSFVLSVIKLISGGRATSHQAQACWNASTSSGGEAANAGCTGGTSGSGGSSGSGGAAGY